MANINLPDLRHIGLTAAGTITVPANETWIIKTANARLVQSLAADAEVEMIITVTINGNSGIVWHLELQKRISGGGDRLGMFGGGGPIFSSSIILKTNDTLVLAKVGTPDHTELDVFYYILETDF